MIETDPEAELPTLREEDVYIYAHGDGSITLLDHDGWRTPVPLADARTSAYEVTQRSGLAWVAGDDAPLAIDILTRLGGPDTHLEPFAANHPPVFSVDGATGMMTAAWSGRFDALVDLIDRGGDVHQSDDWGYTPLHYAAAAGDSRAARVLLEAGARVDATSMVGDSPRDQALLWGHPEVISELEQAGAASTVNTGTYRADPPSEQRVPVLHGFSPWHRFHPGFAALIVALFAVVLILPPWTGAELAWLSAISAVLLSALLLRPWPARTFGVPVRFDGRVLTLRRPWGSTSSYDLTRTHRALIHQQRPARTQHITYLFLAHPDGVRPHRLFRRIHLPAAARALLAERTDRVVPICLIGRRGWRVVEAIAPLLARGRIPSSPSIQAYFPSGPREGG